MAGLVLCGIGGGIAVEILRGQPLTGRASRITKRATVIVEHSQALRWSDRRRYARYYVPVGRRRLVDTETGREPEPRRKRT